MKSYPYMGNSPKTECEWFEILLHLARFLRSPDGCPWDRKQTARAFGAYLLEEARELLEALEAEDNDHIAEEFGDTLFCALMTAVVAEEEGRFVLVEALERTHAKMVRRHGHIFGDHTATTSEEVVSVWRQIKADERKTKNARSTQGEVRKETKKE